jgi:hypothetical protein
MSGIISAKPFNDVFPATRSNSTMQGFVTAIYEVGMLDGPQDAVQEALKFILLRVPLWCDVCHLVGRLVRSAQINHSRCRDYGRRHRHPSDTIPQPRCPCPVYCGKGRHRNRQRHQYIYHSNVSG